MSGLTRDKDQLSIAGSTASKSSFFIADKEQQSNKKKKKTAFQSFLTKPEPNSSPSPQRKRKLSGHEQDQQVIILQKCCLICSKILSDRVKLCQFCKQTMCVVHFRKARKNPNTNKFSRICELCEDRYLMEKHHHNEIKKEQTIASEEELLSIKYHKLHTLKQGKMQMLAQLTDKNMQLAQSKKRQIYHIVKTDAEISKQLKTIQTGSQQNRELKKRLSYLQQMKPPSLENDYNILNSQNQRISKDLHKIKKQVEHALKVKAQLQKKMYEDLYEWQLMEKYKKKSEQKKKEEQCIIY